MRPLKKISEESPPEENEEKYSGRKRPKKDGAPLAMNGLKVTVFSKSSPTPRLFRRQVAKTSDTKPIQGPR